jgi:2-aminoadipate transaminase
MSTKFSDRIADVPRSFIREILKVTLEKDVISFAGGLPNRDLFPVEALSRASEKIFRTDGKDILQYSNSEGYLPLREFISLRYKNKLGLDVPPDRILITSGSQQGLDLLGKTLVNESDDIVIEEPGYLGAIQAFSVYRSRFNTVKLLDDGPDIEQLNKILSTRSPKLFYIVPNFQNPSGITYTADKRREIATVLKDKNLVLVEDDPYGDLRYTGESLVSFYQYIPDKTVLLGTFSKTVVPSFRLGWIVAPDDLLEKLLIAKQASDLHTNYFTQRLVHQFLTDNNLDDHIDRIREVYGRQCQSMIQCIEDTFPGDVAFTKPQGGMFLWITLPGHVSAMQLFHEAVDQKVAFVPGVPFYINRKDCNTLRLNFSCVDEKTIAAGINRLANSYKNIVS